MKRLIGTGLTVLLFSGLMASGAKAGTRYDYQLDLTHHTVPASTQQPASVNKQSEPMAIQQTDETQKPQVMTQQSDRNTIRPITSGNPYAEQNRPLYDVRQGVILPIHNN